MRGSRRFAAVSSLAMLLALASGCKQRQTDNDAIRAGITHHLSSLNTLNLSAMDMDVNEVAIQGGHAHARVTFRPKGGPPAGAGMQVAYQLEKRDADWVVVKTETAGGVIEHPVTNVNPHAAPNPDSMHGELPNFREMLPPSKEASGATLPPGHPPIDATGQTKPKP